MKENSISGWKLNLHKDDKKRNWQKLNCLQYEIKLKHAKTCKNNIKTMLSMNDRIEKILTLKPFSIEELAEAWK